MSDGISKRRIWSLSLINNPCVIRKAVVPKTTLSISRNSGNRIVIRMIFGYFVRQTSESLLRLC